MVSELFTTNVMSSSSSSSSTNQTNSSTVTTLSLPIQTLSNHPIRLTLTKDNYLLWKYQVVTHLNAQNLFGYIDGSKTAPSSTISNPVTRSNQPILIPNPECVAWQQQDQLILSTLIASLSESILSQVLGCNTSRTLWVALERMFLS